MAGEQEPAPLFCDECGAEQQLPDLLTEVAHAALDLPPPLIDALLVCGNCEQPIYVCPRHEDGRMECRRCRS